MKLIKNIWPTGTSYDANQKIWHGDKVAPLYGPHESIGGVALRSLLRDPEHISQICAHNGKMYTNLEIAQLSVSVAEHFKKLKAEQCDIIGICASNSDYLAPLVFGAMLTGMAVSTLDPSFDKDGIKHIFSITKPKFMFCDGSIYDNVKEAFEEMNFDTPIYTMKGPIKGVPSINEFLKENVDPNTYSVQPLKFGSNQTAAIVCSSGTTGKPKGVCVSHAALLNNYIIILDSSDRLLSFSSLYWISGLICLVFGTITGATRIISDHPYTPDDFLEIIQKYRATFLFTTPSLMALTLLSPKLKDYDLSSVVYYLCGGSAIQHSLVEKFLPYIPNAKVIVGYGLSETSNGIAIGESASDSSTGKLVANNSVKIIDDDGKNLGPKEIGEICIQTLHPFAGYYGNEQATKEIYVNNWILSGDLGYFDEDGRLFIIDRKKDILKYNYFHSYPTEIEGVISDLPDVVEVCVCGIPDFVATHLIAAAIVRKTGSLLTEKKVIDHVAKNMSDYKHLRGGVYFLESLPKTASGKNIRREITKLLEKLRHNKIPSVKSEYVINKNAPGDCIAPTAL